MLLATSIGHYFDTDGKTLKSKTNRISIKKLSSYFLINTVDDHYDNRLVNLLMELLVVYRDCRKKHMNRPRGKSVGVFGVTADNILH